jgi:flagellar biogenesis protein FliO
MILLAQLTNAVPLPALPDAGFSVLRVFGALVLVLALFFAGVWLFKNWQRLAARQSGHQSRLNILEAKPLGNRQVLYVVAYDRQRLLVAASPTGITLVSQLPEADAAEAAPAAPPSFAATLSQVLGKKS